MKNLNFSRGFFSLGLILLMANLALAMDADLYNLPLIKDSQLVWKDKAIELNGVSAPSIRFISGMAAEEIAGFYREILLKNKWEIAYESHQPRGIAFKKAKDFIYLVIFDGAEAKEAKRDVYILKSPQDLAICGLLKDQLFEERLTPDLPGRDAPGIVRYPGSKRRMNFSVPAQGNFFMYEADAQPQEVAQFYRRTLKESGWQEETALSQDALGKMPKEYQDKMAVLCFYRDKGSLLINISSAPQQAIAGKRISKRSLIIISLNYEEVPFFGGGRE